MDLKQLILDTIAARRYYPPLSHPRDEPNVVQIAGLGSISGVRGANGQIVLIAHSDRYRNEWGTTQQRLSTLPDPEDEAAAVRAINGPTTRCSSRSRGCAQRPQQRLYFCGAPHGEGSLRPTSACAPPLIAAINAILGTRRGTGQGVGLIVVEGMARS